MFGDSLLPSECSLIVEELKATSLCFQVCLWFKISTHNIIKFRQILLDGVWWRAIEVVSVVANWMTMDKLVWPPFLTRVLKVGTLCRISSWSVNFPNSLLWNQDGIKLCKYSENLGLTWKGFCFSVLMDDQPLFLLSTWRHCGSSWLNLDCKMVVHLSSGMVCIAMNSPSNVQNCVQVGLYVIDDELNFPL